MKKIFTIFLLLLPVFCFSQVAVRIDGLAAGTYPAISGTTGTIITNNHNWRNAVFVSALYGDNDTGTRNNPNRPYSSIQIATEAAIPGDTVVVVDGTFQEYLTNRQNVAYYFYMGTMVTNAVSSTFFADNTITNVTIKGYGRFASPTSAVIFSRATNICTLTLEADYCDGIISGCFLTADVRINTMTNGGFSAVNNIIIPGAGDPAYQVYPLSQPTVSWSDAGQVYTLKNVDYHSVNFIHYGIYYPLPELSLGTMRFYGGTYFAEDQFSPPIEFNDTEVIYTFETDGIIQYFTGNFVIK